MQQGQTKNNVENDLEQQFQQNFKYYGDQKTPKTLEQVTLVTSPRLSRPLTFEQISMMSAVEVNGNGHQNSVRVICKGCNKRIQTVITHKIGRNTLISSLFLFVCSFGLVCISCLPCILNDCKDIVHICPECQAVNGLKRFQIFD